MVQKQKILEEKLVVMLEDLVRRFELEERKAVGGR